MYLACKCSEGSDLSNNLSDVITVKGAGFRVPDSEMLPFHYQSQEGIAIVFNFFVFIEI